MRLPLSFPLFPLLLTFCFGVVIRSWKFESALRCDNQIGQQITSSAWGCFEELVDTQCYVNGAGSVSVQPNGLNGKVLRVHAGETVADINDPKKQNYHVIAQKLVSTCGQTGVYRYSFSAYVDQENLTRRSQAFPEFSIQNTRRIPGNYFTYIAGIQYAGTIHDPIKWKIWTSTQATGCTAGWRPLTWDFQLTLNGVYRFELEVDYTAKYVRVLAFPPGSEVANTKTLNGIAICSENRGYNSQGFWLTLEAQNLWQDCTDEQEVSQLDFVGDYDNVLLEKLSGSWSSACN